MKSAVLFLCAYLFSGVAIASTMSVGAELGASTYVEGYATKSGGSLGFEAGYFAQPSLELRGDMLFTSRAITYTFGPYVKQADSGSETSLSLGPLWKLSRKKLSPLIGGYLTWAHDYAQAYDPYCFSTLKTYSIDSLFLGPTIGVNYDVTQDVGLELGLRYMLNVSNSSNLPYLYNPVTPNYYLVTAAVKFNL